MIYKQEQLHNRAVERQNAIMCERYAYVLTALNRAADQGWFSLVFERDEIKAECVIWLRDNGFEVYSDTGENDDWEFIDSIERIFRANKIKVVW